ncbi:hypothetical protein QE152_g8864 [Popillia japonica]|uniref:Uncharacterized protein n=1 Tax=Popillia japonica TaxID=7064 RepID=A0AAW1M183_POPJA
MAVGFDASFSIANSLPAPPPPSLARQPTERPPRSPIPPAPQPFISFKLFWPGRFGSCTVGSTKSTTAWRNADHGSTHAVSGKIIDRRRKQNFRGNTVKEQLIQYSPERIRIKVNRTREAGPNQVGTRRILEQQTIHSPPTNVTHYRHYRFAYAAKQEMLERAPLTLPKSYRLASAVQMPESERAPLTLPKSYRLASAVQMPES